jgi:hypothetical protein
MEARYEDIEDALKTQKVDMTRKMRAYLKTFSPDALNEMHDVVAWVDAGMPAEKLPAIHARLPYLFYVMGIYLPP